MTTLREAAQRALEALDEADTFHRNLPDQRARRLAAMAALRAALAQAEPVQEPYTGDVTRIMRDAGMTFHLGPPHKAVVEQMTRGVDLVYAEASIKTAQQFSAALAQQAKPVWMHPWPPVRAQQAEPVSADPHTTTLRNLLKFCLPWEPDACVLGNVTARQAVAALRAALAQPVPHGCHVDLDPGMKPDGCVLDGGRPENCIYAKRLLREGKDKTACEYWQPIEVLQNE